MLAKVSPASYLFIIEGQSCWGIFPLLLDLSISRTFSTALVVCCWLASRESTGRCQIDTVSSRANKPTARVTIAAERRALSPRGRTETRALDSEPLHYRLRRERERGILGSGILLAATGTADAARWRSGQIRMILPGFRIPSGSSAIFILRMTLIASPCSAIRKSILP